MDLEEEKAEVAEVTVPVEDNPDEAVLKSD